MALLRSLQLCLRFMKESLKVLIVDDEAGIRKILRMFFELEDCCVSEAANSNDAYDLILESRPDVIVLDVMLGGETGFELCERVKSDKKLMDIKVALFTSLAQEHDIEEGNKVGADLYLTKPQNPKDIVSKIKDLCDIK